MPERNRKRITAAILAAVLFLMCFGCGRSADGIGIPVEEFSSESGPREESESGQTAGTQAESGSGRAADAQAESESSRTAGSQAESRSAPLVVFVCGAVRNPGLYALSEGSRAGDAVRAAGGFSGDADTEFCNLAETVADGQQLRILTKQEAETAEAAKDGLRGADGDEASGQDGSAAEGASTGAGTTADGMVNINQASKEELMTLPGIGEAKAEAIIRYREEQGAFASPEDVMLVPGIKKGAFAKLQGHIAVK